MAKYKVGDRVRIVSRKPDHVGFMDYMEQYLGKTLTVREVFETRHGTYYEFDEAGGGDCFHWAFLEDWIAGLVNPKKENGLRVVIRFDGNVTTARLIRGGTVVKTATARRNPADNYSHAKGAALALEQLFEKKKAKAEKLEAAKAHCRRAAADKSALPKKLGDKFVVKADCYRKISPGTIVTLISPPDSCGVNNYAWKQDGKWCTQLIDDHDLEPYWG